MSKIPKPKKSWPSKDFKKKKTKVFIKLILHYNLTKIDIDPSIPLGGEHSDISMQKNSGIWSWGAIPDPAGVLHNKKYMHEATFLNSEIFSKL